jgi:hypothetical protein
VATVPMDYFARAVVEHGLRVREVVCTLRHTKKEPPGVRERLDVLLCAAVGII